MDGKYQLRVQHLLDDLSPDLVHLGTVALPGHASDALGAGWIHQTRNIHRRPLEPGGRVGGEAGGDEAEHPIDGFFDGGPPGTG